MDKANFPIEFNNEIDDVKKSENEIYTLAVDRLSKLAEGHNDISGGVVKLEAACPRTSDIVYIRNNNCCLYGIRSYRSYGKR